MNRYCYYCMFPVQETDTVCPHCGKPPEVESAKHLLAPGTLLHGRYLLGRALGQGGFGITYIGRDELLNMRVAVKEFYPNGYAYRDHAVSNAITITASGQDFFRDGKQKFLHEARTLARFFEEPGIVSVHDFFEDNNTAYIVMEYLDGLTMKRYVAQNGKIPADKLMRAVQPLIRALDKVHAQGIIHRDISPDNIIVLADGSLKLLDFGAAREVGGDKSMSVMLKPGYAPEEQYRSKGNQGPWTDVYALCATLYFCLTGVRPEESVERAMNPNNTLRLPSELGAQITPDQESVLQRGLAVRAADRYQSMGELANAMFRKEPALRQQTIESGRPSAKAAEKSGDAENGDGRTVFAETPEYQKSAAARAEAGEADEEPGGLTAMVADPESAEAAYAAAEDGGDATVQVAEQKEPGAPRTAKKKKGPLWAGAAALGALVLIGGLYFGARGKSPAAEDVVPVVLTAGPEITAGPELTPAAEPSSEPTPEPTPEPMLDPSFFDDAAFLGDSISGVLEFYGLNNEGLGKPTFLVTVDYSVQAAVDGSTLVRYRGRDYTPENALAAAGVNKVYIMLGAMGDIANYGIDKTMENWATMIANIREKNPEIRIFIQSCTPLAGDSPRLTNQMVDEYNARLKDFAAENDCTFVEIGEHFKDARGLLPYEHCRDGFAHLRIDDAAIWVELLKDPANYSISPRA